MKEPWLEFIINFSDIKSIESEFVKLRNSLKDAGYKEEDLDKMSSAPTEVFMLRDKVINKILKIKKELIKYGLWNDEIRSKFDTYISRKLSKLEKKYPL